MDMKLLCTVAFLFAMQMVPFFAFSHYHPAQTVVQMNKKAEPVTALAINQLLNNSTKKDDDSTSNIERF